MLAVLCGPCGTIAREAPSSSRPAGPLFKTYAFTPLLGSFGSLRWPAASRPALHGASCDFGRAAFGEIVIVCGSFELVSWNVIVPPDGTRIVPGEKRNVLSTLTFAWKMSFPGVFTAGPVPPCVAANAAPATTSIRTAAPAAAYLLLTQPLLERGRGCLPGPILLTGTGR